MYRSKNRGSDSFGDMEIVIYGRAVCVNPVHVVIENVLQAISLNTVDHMCEV